ncbi:PH domain-containing protein [Streptomyces sp. WMMC500]|uniref:PH domain-containing protein n=1 Tax=Streptomyces sp. WMMC500 TaxID=3015154 RepID=UPI00248C7E47|nr:PH domain-containing protein [Streptomyces sp. WMMC500]WBB63507.1 PH domain-containing protein [Streptomyces sp. WMMC500]
MTMPGEQELGAFVGRHQTDVARHGRVGIISLVIGVAAAGAAVPIVIQTFEDASSGTFAGLVVGVALLCLWSGITNGLRYTSRHGEVYTVREGGIVYRRTGESRVIPWESIRNVSDTGQKTAISAAMGWDVHCRIKIRNGKRLILTGFTYNAAELSRTIHQAVREGIHPRAPERG